MSESEIPGVAEPLRDEPFEPEVLSTDLVYEGYVWDVRSDRVRYGDGAIAGVGKVGETKVLPATVFAQYRFGEANASFRPYLGLGVTYAKFFKERTTATLNALSGGTPANPTTADIDDRFGLTPQVGFVYNFNERWFVDAAYYKSFLKTRTHLSSGQSVSIRLNPTVFAVGIGYRF